MRLALPLLAALALCAAPAARGDAPAACPAGCVAVAPPPRDGFTISPYLWLPSVSGTLGTESPDSGLADRVEVTFTKFSEGLRIGGAMVNLGWRAGRWAAWGDWTYANVRTEVPTATGTLFTSSETQIVGNIAQAYAGYSVVARPDVRIDLGAGLRGYWLEGRLALEGGALAGRETSGHGVWTDAVGAARAGWSFENGWELALGANVGAGGSKLSWEAIGVAGYRFGWGTLFGGWRYLAVDYRDGDFVLDVALSGGFVGARFAL